MQKSEPTGILTYRGVVYPWHCDHIGHMNVMWYTGKFDEATWNLFADCGLTARYIKDENRGMVAVQQNTTYKKELMAGDVIAIYSFMLEVREKVVRFRHDMYKTDGELAASTELTGVHLDQETRRSCPMPEAIAARLRELIMNAPG